MTVVGCCQLLTSVNLANLLQISNLKMRIQITVTFINITILLYYTILYYSVLYYYKLNTIPVYLLR